MKKLIIVRAMRSCFNQRIIDGTKYHISTVNIVQSIQLNREHFNKKPRKTVNAKSSRSFRFSVTNAAESAHASGPGLLGPSPYSGPGVFQLRAAPRGPSASPGRNGIPGTARHVF